MCTIFFAHLKSKLKYYNCECLILYSSLNSLEENDDEDKHEIDIEFTERKILK